MRVTACLAATACVHAAPAIVQSFTKVLGKALGQESIDTVQMLSAWTDIDLEQLRYDTTHYGVETISHLGLNFFGLEGVIALSAQHANPYWQGGLLCLGQLHPSTLNLGSLGMSVNDLNAATFAFDQTPMFGGWCERDGRLVFVSFVPNRLKGLRDMEKCLIRWTQVRMRRVAQIASTWSDLLKGSNG